MAEGVLVVVEERQGAVKRPSLEALSASRTLVAAPGEKVIAICFGKSEKSVDLAQYGADRVLLADHPLLADYSPEGYAETVAAAARRLDVRIILGSASSMGRDLLPRVAAKLEVGLAQDCTELRLVDQDRLECVRPIYAGKAFARVRLTAVPAMATIRPNVFPVAEPDPTRSAQSEVFVPDLAEGRIRAKVTGFASEGSGEIELTEAGIIVSGGRGLKGPENFSIIADLAKALGGAVGASRAAVDAGWIDHQHQVGQTGKTVSPTLYVACGISGAIQHLAGMSSSKFIVAVNKDPEAPIFKLADYGIVGDLFQVVPALASEIRRLKSQ